MCTYIKEEEKKKCAFPFMRSRRRSNEMGKKASIEREKEVLLVSFLSRLSSFRKRSRSSAMNLPLMLRFRAQSGLSFFLLFARRLKKKKEVRRESALCLGGGEETQRTLLKKKIYKAHIKQQKKEQRLERGREQNRKIPTWPSRRRKSLEI